MNELLAMQYTLGKECPSPMLHSLTRAQRRVLFAEQSWPGTSFANLGFLVRFKQVIDPAVLEAAILGVLRRHDGLRLRLTSAEHGKAADYMQYVAPFERVAVELRDFSTPDNPQTLAQWAEAQTRIPFKLYDAPLYRFAVLKLPQGKWGYYLKLHHLVADGWTLGLVIDEIRTEIMGGSCPASPPSYREYISGEQAYLSSPEYDEDRSFWAEKLATVPASSSLHPPTKRRSGIRSHRRHIRFPEKLHLQIHTFCQAETTTIFRLCLGALYVFMARSLDRYDVTLAVATHGRTTPSLQQMAGMFVGTFPLRIRVPGECTFRDLLASLRQDLREILAHHQRYPYEDLIRDLRATGVDPGDFASVSIVGHPERYPEDMNIMTMENGHDPAAMVLHVFTDGNYGGGEFDLMMDCQVDLFSPEEMACMERALLTILSEVTRSPDLLVHDPGDQPIATLNQLSAKDQQQLLIDWNATQTALPATCVHQLFETQVKATPDATAVVFEDEILTYYQLNSRANQLAHHLIVQGVEADGLVAIAMERLPAMIVALLAVLKAGGAYVPLDPEYPAERLAYMLEDCGARILITLENLRNKLPQTVLHTLCLDSAWATIAKQPPTDPDRLVSPEQLAYVIYTSGSTGKPKGVAIEHRGLSNLARSQSSWFGITPESRVGQFASASFDASVSEVMMTLCCGAALYLPNAEEHQPGKPLWQFLEKNAITHLTLPPAALAVLPRQPMKKLAQLIVAGESCPPALAKYWSIGRRFFNAYGPTETTVCATIALCTHADIDRDAPLPIGRPIANTQLYILDRHNQPTPIGVPGELHIGGVGLARGYLNRPELTAEKFIADPFSKLPGARLYKTGDLVRYRVDGNIEFLGRLDHQVKIRGFRIELGEIEAALAAHPNIRESVVVARNEEAYDMRLAAYLVAGDPAPGTAELRVFLKSTLPDYMIPAVFVFLDDLPLTPNGKIDRKALPEPRMPIAEKGYHLPRDSFEQQMIALWENLLSVRPIGIHDNFFDIGGHSLLAVRLVTEMNRKFRKHLPISRLFEFPTIAGMASILRKSGDMPAASCLVKIRQQGTHSPLFVLPGASGMTTYLYPFAHHLAEDIPVFAFQAQGLEGERLPHTDFAEMVEHYVELLRGVQPTGPYFLIGHSFGAMVAFAMAQKLLVQGQSIGMLAILDTPAPTGPPSHENNWLAGEVPLLVLIGQFLCVIFDREITFSKESVEGLNDQEQLTFIARQLAEANLLPEEDITDHLRGLLNVFKSQLMMQVEYLPKSFLPLPITLFRAKELMMYLSNEEIVNEDMDWGIYSSRPVPVRYVPGNHVTMMTLPHVKKLAALVTAEMKGQKK